MSNRASSPPSTVLLSDISSTNDQSSSQIPLPHPTPIHVIMSTGTPVMIPRINSNSNLHGLNDGFSLTSDDNQLNTNTTTHTTINSTNNNTNNTIYTPNSKQFHHSLSQLSFNSHLHDQVASEVDYSAYLGKQQYLFAHTPATTYNYSQSLFNITYKKLLSLLTFLFTLHWFNHGIFQTILTEKSDFKASESTLILSASLIAILFVAPGVGYLARSHPPLRILWVGYCIILLSTFITAFSHKFYAMFWYEL